MSLYSIYADSDTFRTIAFDSDQMFEEYGSLRNHFSVNYEPVPFAGRMNSPFQISLSGKNSEFSGDEIPDISEHYGRLYLSIKAYEAIGDLIKGDGEFLPALCDGKEAFIFNTTRVAEDADGLDEKLSVKDAMGNCINVAFHSERVSEFMIFKTEFDGFISAYCQSELKDAIDAADLKGVYFTQDLGNRLSKAMS